MFSAIMSPRMFSTASLVYLLIVTNWGVFGEVRLTFRLIKTRKVIGYCAKDIFQQLLYL